MVWILSSHKECSFPKPGALACTEGSLKHLFTAHQLQWNNRFILTFTILLLAHRKLDPPIEKLIREYITMTSFLKPEDFNGWRSLLPSNAPDSLTSNRCFYNYFLSEKQ